MPGQITPIGVGSVTPYPSTSSMGPQIFDQNVPPGDTNAPVIFEPRAPLTAGTTQVFVIATGGENWGGCEIHVSTDGSTYSKTGTILSGGRQGVLTTGLPATSDPDTIHTLGIDLTESQGQVISGTKDDADTYITLCYCDGELISYQTAVLTSLNKYNLTYLRRGAYGSAITTHSSGTQFARFGPSDGTVFKYPYPPSFIGRTLNIKLPAFNIFGAEIQDLSEVATYSYLLTGVGLLGGTGFVLPPPAPFASMLTRPIMTVILDDADIDDGDEAFYRNQRTAWPFNQIWQNLQTGVAVDMETATGSLDLNDVLGIADLENT